MKKINLLVAAILLLMISCFDRSTNPTATNDFTPPEACITYPETNSEFAIGTEVVITAEATDNKTVKEVRFFIDGEFFFSDMDEPYEIFSFCSF